MTADQFITLTGTDTGLVSSFTVNSTLGGFVTRPNATYYVAAQLSGVTSIVGVDISSRTTTGFTVQLTAALQATTDTIQFHIFDPVTPAGTLLATHVFGSGGHGTGTYTPATGANRAWLRIVGAGGGGGGAAKITTTGAAVGAGGSSGVFVEKWIDPGAALTGGSWTTGTGGTAGSNTGGNGGSGGDSTIVVNGTTYTAKGGGGGVGGAINTGNGGSFPTAPASGSSAGDASTYQNGGISIVAGGSAWWSGFGGSSPLGAGGLPVGSTTAGKAGATGGGGGSGASNQSTSAGQAGGAGGDGLIIIYDYA